MCGDSPLSPWYYPTCWGGIIEDRGRIKNRSAFSWLEECLLWKRYLVVLDLLVLIDSCCSTLQGIYRHMSLLILDQHGSAITGTIDFGEAYIDSPKPSTQFISLQNTSQETMTLYVETVNQVQGDDNIMTAKVLSTEDATEPNLLILPEFPQQDIIIFPQSKIDVMLCICYTIVGTGDKMKQRKVRSRYAPAHCTLQVRIRIGSNPDMSTQRVPITAMFCESIMAVDEKDIEFDSCVEGHIYVRDVQIWNRSECELQYHIAPLSRAPLPIVFSDFESGRPLALYESIRLPAFSSQRIRVTLHAKVGLVPGVCMCVYIYIHVYIYMYIYVCVYMEVTGLYKKGRHDWY